MAVREQLDVPPSTVVYDETGKEIAVIAKGKPRRGGGIEAFAARTVFVHSE